MVSNFYVFLMQFSFVKSVLDIEALKKQEFQQSYLIDTSVVKKPHQTTVEAFLLTFEQQASKVIRKIDKLDPSVERQFSSLVMRLAEITSQEEFEKSQIKK